MRFHIDATPSCTRREFLSGAAKLSGGVTAVSLAAGCLGRAAWPWPASQPSIRATLRIDPERQLGTIDPNVYGYFIEHFPKCVYGGIYDEGSSLSDGEGMRKDVLEAARKLRVTQLRWPGGNFVSGYHWQDGVGPKQDRPARFDLAWRERESNRFGTDEFMSFCRKLGTEPYICVNMGTGTLDEAAGWVEYCNSDPGTYYSDLRKKNGHAAPYRVKYWGLGNEIWGDWQIGHKNAEDYAKNAIEFAKVMKWRDPSIKLIACGDGDPHWDMPALEALGDRADYLSVHHYTTVHQLKEYYEIMGSLAQMETMIRAAALSVSTVAARAHRPSPAFIALDEWAIDHRSPRVRPDEDDFAKVEWVSTLSDSLWVASALNLIQRHCSTVRMANVTFLVNGVSPIVASPAGVLLRPIYFVLQLYADRSGPIALDVLAEGPRFATRSFGDLPYLDVSASYNPEKRRVAVAAVNRHKESDVIGTVVLAGVRAKPGGRVFAINGLDLEGENTFANPRNVVTQEQQLPLSGDRWEYRFPPHSLTWMEFEVEAGG
jgi:alpha-N-arabinofuranosidase